MTTDSHVPKREFLIHMQAGLKLLSNSLMLQRDLLNKLTVLMQPSSFFFLEFEPSSRPFFFSNWKNSFANTSTLLTESLKQQGNGLQYILEQIDPLLFEIKDFTDLSLTTEVVNCLKSMGHKLELQIAPITSISTFPTAIPQYVLNAPLCPDIESIIKVWGNPLNEKIELLSLMLQEQSTNQDRLQNIIDEMVNPPERTQVVATNAVELMSRRLGVFPVPPEYENNWFSYPHDDLYASWEETLSKNSDWEKVKKRLDHFDSSFTMRLLLAMAIVGVPSDSWGVVFADIFTERRAFKGLSRTLWEDEDNNGEDPYFLTQYLLADQDNRYGLVFPPIYPVWLVNLYSYDQNDYLEDLQSHWSNLIGNYWIPWETQSISHLTSPKKLQEPSQQKGHRAPKVQRTPSAIDKILEIGEEGRRQIDLMAQQVNSHIQQ